MSSSSLRLQHLGGLDLTCVMLFRLPDGNTAESVRTGLAETTQRLPADLWQSLIWDQGKEMA